MDEKFNIFMGTVDERFRSFASQINGYLTGNGCKCDIKPQKSGYVERTLATFVSRKTGMKLTLDKRGKNIIIRIILNLGRWNSNQIFKTAIGID